MLRTLLVPLDGSSLAERAVPVACALAKRTGGAVHLVRAHVPITVVGATAEGAIFSQDMLAADDAVRRHARTYVTGVAERAAAAHGVRVTPLCEDGSPAGLIQEVADRLLADLIVMTTHGAGGFAPDWLGSVADAVIRHSHRPVLTLPENEAHPERPFAPRRITVTLDGSERAATILPVARDLALAYGATLDLVRVVAPYIPGDVISHLPTDRPDPFGIDAEAALAKRALDDIARTFTAGGVATTATVRMDLSPTKSLQAHLKETDPDVVAVATQGRGLSRVFVGSVADKLVRTAGRPVLVLRPTATRMA
jgi:nucleotide-binding universal stress UspA family protein